MTNYSELFERNEQERQAMAAAESQLRKQYIDSAAAFLKGWYESQAKAIVTTQPNITNNLKPEDIKELKEEVKALAERAPEIAATWFSRSRFWRDLSKPVRGTLSDADMNQTLRFAAGLIAPVLTKRGFRVDAKKIGDAIEMGGTLGDNAEMAGIKKKYSELWGKFINNLDERESLERKQAEEKASDSWDRHHGNLMFLLSLLCLWLFIYLVKNLGNPRNP